MITLQNKKRRIRDWKSGILSSEKKVIEHLPVIGIWFWKLRVYGELKKLEEAGKRGASAGEKCRKQFLSNIE